MKYAKKSDSSDEHMVYIHIASNTKNSLFYNAKKSTLTATITVKDASGRVLSYKRFKASGDSDISYDEALEKASRLIFLKQLKEKGILKTLGLNLN